MRAGFFILFILICRSGHCQHSTTLPAAFIGHWKGELEWRVAGKAPKTFAMELLVKPADSPGHYSWLIRYGSEGNDQRPYLLKPVDSANGHWVIDEQNGIVLDSYLLGNSLHGAFTVQNNTIIDRYSLQGDSLQVSFLMIRLQDRNRSGKGTDEIPYADSYRISGYQSGILIRQPANKIR